MHVIQIRVLPGLDHRIFLFICHFRMFNLRSKSMEHGKKYHRHSFKKLDFRAFSLNRPRGVRVSIPA